MTAKRGSRAGLAHSRRVCCTTLLLLASAITGHARADGGYFSGALGARATGRGGAFVARADDLSAVTYNPAGLSLIGTTLIEIGNSASYNAYSYTRSPTLNYGQPSNGTAPLVAFAPARNQTPWQALDPLAGVASNLGLRDWGFALAVNAPPGTSREEYPVGGGQRYMMVERDAVILDYSANVAWKYHELFGLGVGLHWVNVPLLKYQLVLDANTFPARANPVSSDLDMLATVSGSDPFIFNAIVGAWYRPVPFLEFAISGQVVPSEIHTHSTVSVVPLSPAVVDSVELRRGNQQANDVTLSLPLPMTGRIGVRYRKLDGREERFDVELDAVYESWSRVQRFTMDSNGIVARLLGQNVDIGRIDVQKHWRDTLAFHLGGDYQLLPRRVTVRAGVFYQSATADNPYANVDFVGGAQVGGAFGASVFFQKLELAASYEYRVQPQVSISESNAQVFQTTPGSPCRAPYTDTNTCNANYLGRPAPAVNAGTYRAFSHIASIAALYRF